MGVKKLLKAGNRWIKRGLCALLVYVSALSWANAGVLAAGGTENESTQAIAIVFDNSGSMYVSGNMAWCRATYAMEVFASMMNEGDALQVYPMCEVTVDGRTYTSQDPFSVSGGGDTSAIRNMYTPYAGDTPIETIEDAYAGLEQTDADAKWLIVLTDGDEFYENGESLGQNTKARLSEKLTECCQTVNVLYLGIGEVAIMPEVAGGTAHQFFADKASNSADVLAKLTNMCNMIFGRNELPSVGSQFSFDVSMKKLIVFVQGSDISGVSLKTSAGTLVGSPGVEYSPCYGEQGSGNYTSFGIDRDLSGYLAVYDTELPAGTYSLEYFGNVSAVSIYYEPDVDLIASLTGEDGAEVTGNPLLYPGSYSINYGLVDREGQMTSSDLMGQTHYTVEYSVGGEERTAASDQSGRVELELAEGDTLDGRITVTYLDGYTITKNAGDFGWPAGGFRVVASPIGALELRVDGPGSYVLSQRDQWAPITVSLYADGAPLTDEQMAACTLTVNGADLTYTAEPIEGQSAYQVCVGADDGVQAGKYDFQISAAVRDETGREISAQESETVELLRYPRWLQALAIGILLLLLLLLVLLWLNMKVLPKKIGIVSAQTMFIVDGDTVKSAAKCTYSGGGKKNGTLRIAVPPYGGSQPVTGGFTLTLQAVSPRRVKSGQRRVLVKKIAPSNTAALRSLSIANHTLAKAGDDAVWIFDNKETAKPTVATAFEMGGKPTCVYTGSIAEKTDFTLKVQLQFK